MPMSAAAVQSKRSNENEARAQFTNFLQSTIRITQFAPRQTLVLLVCNTKKY